MTLAPTADDCPPRVKMRLFHAAIFLLVGAKALAAAAPSTGVNELEETRRTTDTKYKSMKQEDSAAISSEVDDRELQEDIYMSIGEDDMSMSVDYGEGPEDTLSPLNYIRFPDNFSFRGVFDISTDESYYVYKVSVLTTTIITPSCTLI